MGELGVSGGGVGGQSVIFFPLQMQTSDTWPQVGHQ